MSKNIVDGVLVEMSPSMLVAFDETTSFGCERKGWFKYVMGLPEPQTGNQELGTNLHALVEHRLTKGEVPSGEGEAFGLYLAGQAMIEAVAARKILKVEQPIPAFFIEGVLLKGYNDVVTSDGIVDWKTSSDIRRYGKTASELATDTAMVLYGKSEHPTLQTVKLAHGQFQTKGRKSTDFVEVEVTQEHLDNHISKVIIPQVERIRLVAGFTDAEQTKADRTKCFNCAFKTRCPTPESKQVMSFFSKMNASTSSTSPASSLLNGGDMATSGTSLVKPPDAPESKPELAAKPVEGFTAVPPPRKREYTDVAPKEAMVAEMVEAKPTPVVGLVETEVKRGRGRPPGSPNKPKVEVTTSPLLREGENKVLEVERVTYDPQASADMRAEQARARKFKSVTISKGCTINVGNFSGVRFDVSVTSEEHTYEEVYAEVSRRLDEEAAKYEAEKLPSTVKGQLGPMVPANELVSK